MLKIVWVSLVANLADLLLTLSQAVEDVSRAAVVQWNTRWTNNPGITRSIPCFFGLLNETLKAPSPYVLVVAGTINPSSLTQRCVSEPFTAYIHV